MLKKILIITMLAIGLQAQAPDWAVNAHDFEYSASLVGQVRQDADVLDDASALISAWNGSQICGVAAMEHFAVNGQPGFIMTLYSNANGNEISFKYYDSVADTVLPVAENLIFQENALWGDFDQPKSVRVMTPDPEWNINPHQFEFDMSVTAVLNFDGVESRNSSDAVAAYIGAALAGTARPVYYPDLDRYVCSMPVYSNATSGQVSFRLYDSENGFLHNAVNTLDFAVNGQAGDYFNPWVISTTTQFQVDFSADITSGYLPLPVQFTALAEGAAAWAWDFGDGSTSQEENPLHTYQEAGIFTVSLTADNGTEQKMMTKTGYIQVQQGENGNWDAPYALLRGTAEADIVVRTGDIDNLGFGWGSNYDPFSGETGSSHSWPFTTEADDPAGTDTIMVPSSFTGDFRDGYSQTVTPPYDRFFPEDIVLTYDLAGVSIHDLTLQLFVDDFQAPSWGTKFQVSIDGQRIPELEALINGLDQTGPVGKMITFVLPPAYYPLFSDGRAALLIDDPVTGVGDGFALDFVRLLVNTKTISNTGTMTGYVKDGAGTGVSGAVVSASGVSDTTQADGQYVLNGVPAGLVLLTVQAPGFEYYTQYHDLAKDQTLQLDVVLTSGGLTPDFSVSQRFGDAPLTVQFTDLTSGDVASRSWDFGDGSTGSGPGPVHSYTDTGYFDVSLTVTSSTGSENSVTKEKYIHVTQPYIPGDEPEGWFWQNPLPHGLTLNSVAAPDANTLIAVGNNGLIQVSDDGGQSWTFSESPVDESLLDVFFINSSTGWIVGSGGCILKSSDGGHSWVQLNSGTAVALDAVWFTDDLHGWAGGTPSWSDSDHALMRTQDGGNSWEALNASAATSTQVYDLCFVNSSTGWAVTKGDSWYSSEAPRVLKTTDGGQTWSVQYEESADYSLELRAVHFIDANRGWIGRYDGSVLKTTDGGSNWTVVDAGIFRSYTIQFAADGLHGWTAGQNGGYAYTTDGGQTWQTANHSNTVTHLAFAGTATGYIVGERGLCKKSNDGGVTWLSLQKINPASDVNDLLFVNSGRGWAVGAQNIGMYGDIFRSDDGGNSWNTINTGLSGTTDFNDILMTPDGALMIVGDWDIYGSGEAVMLRSDDDGQTWTGISNGVKANLNKVVFTDAQTAWAIGGSYSGSAMSKSEDGGNTWTAMTCPVATELRDLVFIDAMNIWIAASGTKLLHTTDGGANWTVLTGPAAYGDYTRLDRIGADTLFVSSGSSLYRSVDAGANWLKVQAFPQTVTDMQFVSQTGWVATYGGIYMTEDGGESWVPQVEADNLNLYTLCFINNTVGWAGGSGGKVLKTSTAGRVLTGIGETPYESTTQPTAFSLRQNYPNPFNPQTTISFDLPAAGPVRLAVFDLRGRKLLEPVNAFLQPGRYSVVVNAGHLSSGLYLYQLQAGGLTEIRKMTVLK